MNRQIKWMIKERGVQCFYHFTPFVNLPNILKFGIISRDSVSQKIEDGERGKFMITDTERLEGRTDCICMSVSFPNYKMFFKKRKELPAIPFVLLEIDIEGGLCCPDTSFAFFDTNAATGRSKKNPISDEEILSHCTLEAAKQMFREEGRSKLIPPSYPTNPQAEVLFKGMVSPKAIKRYLVGNREDWVAVYNYPGMEKIQDKIQIDKKLFSPREDYTQW